MYKLYIDKNELFECEVAVKNASLKNSQARLIIESNDVNLVFNGSIQNGTCKIPIKKLKGLLQENTQGKIHLEVIVEDTYFKPWESDFVVEEHTSVKVQIKEQSLPQKPSIEISMKKEDKPATPSAPNLSKVAINEIVGICDKFGINKSNAKDKKSEFVQILKEYFKSNPEFIKYKKEIVATYLYS